MEKVKVGERQAAAATATGCQRQWEDVLEAGGAMRWKQ